MKSIHEGILIVDDDRDTLEVMSVPLSPSYECRTAGAWDDALKAINEGLRPDCVLMDYAMAGMLLEEFLRSTMALDLNVVLMTGHADAVAISELLGLSSSLQKPIAPEALLRAVKAVAGA